MHLLSCARKASGSGLNPTSCRLRRDTFTIARARARTHTRLRTCIRAHFMPAPGWRAVDLHALGELREEGGGALLLHRLDRHALLQVLHKAPQEGAEVLRAPDVARHLASQRSRVLGFRAWNKHI